MTTAPHILILGGASAIAVAYARLRAPSGARFTLAGRNAERLAATAADLIARGAASAGIYVVDFAQTDALAGAAAELRRQFGEPDEVVLAYGALDQTAGEADLARARAVIETNYVSPALMLLGLLGERDPSKRLSVVVIGSVAGDRGRASNFVYGSAKGGLEIFVEGLRHKISDRSVRFVFVKPGLVDTPMTAKIAKGGLLWASPEEIAAGMLKAVSSGKRVVYVPWFWRPVMTAIRFAPWFLFKRFRI